MTNATRVADVRRFELAAQRACFALLVLVHFRAMRAYSEQPEPVGIARHVDFTFLADPRVSQPLEIGLLLALLLYAIGTAMPLVTAYMLVLWTGAGALINSQGGINHHTQLVGMVLFAQLLAYAQHGAARLAGRSAASPDPHETAVWYTKQTIVAAYVLAGLMKIVRSRGMWLWNLPNLSVEIVKTHAQYFQSHLDDALIARGDALAALLLSHPMAARVVLGASLLLELASIAALLGRRAGLVVGLALFAMHRAITFLMLIQFRENEWLVLIYLAALPVLVARWLCSRAWDVATPASEITLGVQWKRTRAALPRGATTAQ